MGKTKSVPICPWRFGEKYLVTDFIMPTNVAVNEELARLSAATDDEFVEKVAEWIRDNFEYPLDDEGYPSAQGQLQRHEKSIGSWHFNKSVYYMWSLPNEVLLIKKGICIDTSNLAESVLRTKPLEKAWCCLGEVRRTEDDTLLGYHAWVQMPYNEEDCVLETTIHEAGANNLTKADIIYGKGLPVYFIKHAQFNEKDYHAISPGGRIVQLMGYPGRELKVLGFENLVKIEPKRIYMMWRKEQNELLKAIWEAFKLVPAGA